jgi:chromosome segregation ATPase
MERLTKEINEEYRLESELLKSRKEGESSNVEIERLKNDCAIEKSAKQKAENLCNELQNKHKQIVDDANKASEEGRQKRIKITEEYQNELTERQRKLEEVLYQRAEYDKYNKLLKEKMTELIGYVEERDKSFSTLLEEKNKEIESLKLQTEAKPSAEEEKLKEELEIYKKKFEDFQNSLTQSNQQFAFFKKDMDQKAKLFKSVQLENRGLKQKQEEFGHSLQQLKEEIGILTESVKKHENDISKATELKRKLSQDN